MSAALFSPQAMAAYLEDRVGPESAVELAAGFAKRARDLVLTEAWYWDRVALLVPGSTYRPPLDFQDDGDATPVALGIRRRRPR
jgi:hypothetical protein